MYAGDESPLRSELFSSDRMEIHGETLAGSHRLGPEGIRDKLLNRLAENERVLTGACSLLTSAVDANRRIAPAGEWLLDNFYLIEEQIRTAKRHLPKGYSRELPRLLDGPSAGLPRVYDIAHEAISHGDGRVDPESLTSFVASYQKVTVLTLGELWAIPIMLRLALIENLRRVGARVAAGSIDRDLAARWAEQMVVISEKDPKSLILLTADMARSDPPMVSSFVAEFARRLQGQSTALALPLTWIEQRLSESGLTIEEMVRSENQQKAADQVSVSNSIASLRFLGAMDWREFVETMSAVEQALREDPGGTYGRMDFTTRDRYRHVVEKIAKWSRLHEADVAREAILLAGEAAAGSGPDDRTAHVGFYLVDKGLPRLERAAGARLPLPETLRRTAGRISLHLYLGSITLLTVVFSGALLAKAHAGGVREGPLALFGALSLLCASRLAVALVNWLSTVLVAPHPLPRMDFSEGIPPEWRTLVVIPAMLASARNIESLVESLEVRFLANRDENLHFALLTDFLDADEETAPEDEELLRLARKGIEELNGKYGSAKSDPFFLFHRPRRWNPRERTWMGYERKRGKLAELNLFLRGEARDRFSVVVGRTADLSNVKFVIPLDTDTQLPRDSARQFVGAMAHPLNRARYDGRMERICRGARHPAAARGRQPVGHEPVAVCATVRERTGDRPIHARRLRRVPGRVRGRLLHRQGDLRRRRVRPGPQGTSSREPDPQPRSPGRVPRAGGTAERCEPVRGIPVQLPRGRKPPPPLDPRGLADRRVAAVARSRSRRRPPQEPALRALPMEDLRQSSAQPRAFRVDAPAAGGLDLPVRRLVWTAVGGRDPPASFGVGLRPRAVPEARRRAAAAAPRRRQRARAGRHFAQAVFTLACLPHEAFFSLDAIVRTAVADAVHAQAASRMDARPATPGSPTRRRVSTASFRSMWIAPAIAAAATIDLGFEAGRAG